MVTAADTPAITPSFTSMLPAFGGRFTDASGFTGVAIEKPPVSLRLPCPDTAHTSPKWSSARSATLAGMTNADSICPTAPPSVGAAAGANALSNARVTLLWAFRPKVRSPADPLRSEEHTSELQSLRHLVCRL